MTEDKVTKESIQAEFRGWDAFQGVDRRWHARLRGAKTPLMVHGEDLIDLRDEIRRAVCQAEERAWQRQHRPEGSNI